MNERLSSSDMSSLLAERGAIHANVGATIVLEGEPPAFGDFLEHVSARLAMVPRFRQRVTEVPLGRSNPVWTDDPRARSTRPSPLSPQGHALAIGVVSYDGGVFFGLAGDRDAVRDIDDLAAAIEASIEELE